MAVSWTSIEAGELDPVRAAAAVEPGQPGQERMSSVELVGSVVAEEDEGDVAQRLDEEAEGLARGLVRPVQVLEDDQRGRSFGQALEEAQQPLEQAGLDPLGLGEGDRLRRAERRDEPGEVGARWTGQRGQLGLVAIRGRAPQDVDERSVRQAGSAEVHALPTEHAEPTFGREPRDLIGEPGLADARLARDQQVDRLPAAARSSASAAASSSAVRPTKTGLLTRPAMPSSIRAGLAGPTTADVAGVTPATGDGRAAVRLRAGPVRVRRRSACRCGRTSGDRGQAGLVRLGEEGDLAVGHEMLGIGRVHEWPPVPSGTSIGMEASSD